MGVCPEILRESVMSKNHRPKKPTKSTYNFIAPLCPADFNPVVIANFDGGLSGRGGRPCWSWVVADPSGKEWDAGRCDDMPAGLKPTFNTAEFLGMLECVKRSIPLAQGGPILFRGDSKLVIGAMTMGWRMPASPWLASVANQARAILATSLSPVFFEWVPRKRNSRADELGRGAESQAALIAQAVKAERGAIVEYLHLRQGTLRNGEEWCRNILELVAADFEALRHLTPARAEQDAA